MKATGSNLFSAVSQMANPAEFISKLGDRQLVDLSKFLNALPETGWPAVVRLVVRTEMANRFTQMIGGGK